MILSSIREALVQLERKISFHQLINIQKSSKQEILKH